MPIAIIKYDKKNYKSMTEEKRDANAAVVEEVLNELNDSDGDET